MEPEAVKIWRLTLDCGHFRMSGPWENDEPQTQMIGDITWCEVCPSCPDLAGRQVMRLRQVVNVEQVPGELYREPDGRSSVARQDQPAL